MDDDLTNLLCEHDLRAAVPFLEKEGWKDLEKLRMLEESDVDNMAQRHHTFPLTTAKLLKSKIRDKVLVDDLEQIKAQQVGCTTYMCTLVLALCSR